VRIVRPANILLARSSGILPIDVALFAPLWATLHPCPLISGSRQSFPLAAVPGYVIIPFITWRNGRYLFLNTASIARARYMKLAQRQSTYSSIESPRVIDILPLKFREQFTHTDFKPLVVALPSSCHDTTLEGSDQYGPHFTRIQCAFQSRSGLAKSFPAGRTA